MTTWTASVSISPAATRPPDSVGAAQQLLRDVARGGLNLSHSLFVAYFIQLPAHEAGEALPAAVRDGWDVTSYADAAGYVMRLAHERLLAVAEVQRDSSYVTEFAATYGGCWYALTVEDLHRPTYWESLASQFGARDRGPSTPAPARLVVPVVRQAGAVGADPAVPSTVHGGQLESDSADGPDDSGNAVGSRGHWLLSDFADVV